LQLNLPKLTYPDPDSFITTTAYAELLIFTSEKVKSWLGKAQHGTLALATYLS